MEKFKSSNIIQQQSLSRDLLEQTLQDSKQFVSPLKGRCEDVQSRINSQTDIKDVVVHHRPNKINAPYLKFDISPFKQPFSVDRM